MFGFEKYERHADLVDRMADTLGMDLTEEVQRGELPPQELRRSVQRCMGCREAKECGSWLAEHSNGADAPPSYCRNGDLFASLSGR